MKSFFTSFSFLIISLIVVLQGCDDNSISYDFNKVPAPYDRSEAIRDTTIGDSLKVYVIKEGEGSKGLPGVTPNDQIRAKYTGRTKDGRVFTSTYSDDISQRQEIFSGLTPSSRVIEGFRKGVLGMQEGEKRIIVIPPPLGYPTRATGCFRNPYKPCRFAFDPVGQTVIFDVKLVRIF